MSGWVHVEHRAGQGKVCYAAVQTGETPTPCGCQTPTPDRASPCGWEMDRGQGRCDLAANRAEHRGCDDWRCQHDGRRRGYNCHRYRPTRCTCGHPIEERA